MTTQQSRHRFLKQAAAAGAIASTVQILPRNVLGGATDSPASEKINLAGVGLGGRGCGLLGNVAIRTSAKVLAGKPHGNPVKLLCDAQNGGVTNLPEANAFLQTEYRKGWEPPARSRRCRAGRPRPAFLAGARRGAS